MITLTELPDQEIAITYNANGRLLKWDATSMHGLQPLQLQWLKNATPAELTDPKAQFTQMIASAKGKIAITQGAFDVSFDTFWKAYAYARNSYKAKEQYNKLIYADKVALIGSLVAYNAYCRKNQWYNKQLADSYIRNKQWLNDWVNG
jgi:hypothetical protein